MKRLLLCSALMLVSCASPPAPKTMTLPDGRVAQMAYCDGNSNSIAACYNLAAERCGGPYELVNKDGSSDIAGAVQAGVGGSMQSMTRREIAYVCKS